MNDVLLNKASIILRCIKRIQDVYGESDNFVIDFTRQDSVILNLQRACEASIDISNIIIKNNKLGIPQSSRDSFTLLQKASLLSFDIADSMRKMVGLRNIAVHDYQAINLDIIVSVIENHLTDFNAFITEIKSL